MSMAGKSVLPSTRYSRIANGLGAGGWAAVRCWPVAGGRGVAGGWPAGGGWPAAGDWLAAAGWVAAADWLAAGDWATSFARGAGEPFVAGDCTGDSAEPAAGECSVPITTAPQSPTNTLLVR